MQNLMKCTKMCIGTRPTLTEAHHTGTNEVSSHCGDPGPLFDYVFSVDTMLSGGLDMSNTALLHLHTGVGTKHE